MKKSTHYFLAILLLLTSCVSLDENPSSYMTTDQFYRNGADAVAAVNAIYHRMFTEELVLFNRQLMMYEMSTDDCTAGPRTRSAQVIDMSKLNHVSNNLAIEWTWKYTYDAINRANIAIDRIAEIPEEEIEETLRQRLINEAKFLRGWNYFNLVRWHGEVPLVLHETTSLSQEALNVSQATEEEIYRQIIEDLSDAEELPAPEEYNSNDAGRATSGAASTLLIKVYLTREEWNTAARKAEELISKGWHDLFENFEDVYNVATKNGREHIFSAQHKGNIGYDINHLAFTTAPVEFNGDYIDAPNHESGLFESFSEQDTRKYVTFVKEMTDPATGELITLSDIHWNKYWDPDTPYNQAESSKNLPLLRYADVLLMYAEASNELGNKQTAYTYLDKIRERAGIPLLQDIAPNLSVEEFRDSLFQERRKELALEYQRWFDLSRRGSEEYIKALRAAGKNNVAARHIRFPIPQRELDLNPNLKQIELWRSY
ncbi:MAG: RagB/SusD family nutrient uptake outer membrane protein [Bacteroides sp.]|nr:RagB/SusD family nutrient uptake outer membrane protein [Bacteroides sp.]